MFVTVMILISSTIKVKACFFISPLQQILHTKNSDNINRVHARDLKYFNTSGARQYYFIGIDLLIRHNNVLSLSS